MYKRSQVEWALTAFKHGRRPVDDEPDGDLVNTLRRLIDVDRQLDVTDEEPLWTRRFAFLSRALPGRGVENAYGLEQVVALWIALEFLDIGIPQSGAIQFMRVIRSDLKKAIRTIQAQAPDVRTDPARQRRIEQGFLLEKPDDLAYVASDQVSGLAIRNRTKQFHASAPALPERQMANICLGAEELAAFIDHLIGIRRRAIVVEIANAVLSLDYWLARAPAKKRGRPS